MTFHMLLYLGVQELKAMQLYDTLVLSYSIQKLSSAKYWQVTIFDKHDNTDGGISMEAKCLAYTDEDVRELERLKALK